MNLIVRKKQERHISLFILNTAYWLCFYRVFINYSEIKRSN